MVGREAEEAAVARFPAAVGDGPSALVLDGEPGIGKTAVWERGVALAGDLVCWLLCARAVEAEAKLGFTVLGDLLREVPEATLEGLPPPAGTICGVG
jgi:hypothetical protein